MIPESLGGKESHAGAYRPDKRSLLGFRPVSEDKGALRVFLCFPFILRIMTSLVCGRRFGGARRYNLRIRHGLSAEVYDINPGVDCATRSHSSDRFS